MEEKKSVRPHSIVWSDRKAGSITGVTDVLSFDEDSVVLRTEQGMLTVKGKDLHIGRLTLEKGEVDMEGTVDSLAYSAGDAYRRSAESLFARLFR